MNQNLLQFELYKPLGSSKYSSIMGGLKTINEKLEVSGVEEGEERRTMFTKC